MTDLRPLTDAEHAALGAYAAAEGRQWKSRLNQTWMDSSRPLDPLLRGLRNSHGPSWLLKYRPPKPVVDTSSIPLEVLLADPRLSGLIAAATPFARIGHRALEVRREETGSWPWVWGGGEQRQRITTWFGPSDFGGLIQAFEDLGLPFIGED